MRALFVAALAILIGATSQESLAQNPALTDSKRKLAFFSIWAQKAVA